MILLGEGMESDETEDEAASENEVTGALSENWSSRWENTLNNRMATASTQSLNLLILCISDHLTYHNIIIIS